MFFFHSKQQRMKWQRTYWPFVYDYRGEEASPKVWDVSLKSLFMLLPNMKAESLVQVQTKRVKWAVRTWKWWVKWYLSEGNGIFPHREWFSGKWCEELLSFIYLKKNLKGFAFLSARCHSLHMQVRVGWLLGYRGVQMDFHPDILQ